MGWSDEIQQNLKNQISSIDDTWNRVDWSGEELSTWLTPHAGNTQSEGKSGVLRPPVNKMIYNAYYRSVNH